MEQDMKKEARKQYLRYFRFWFLAVGILAAIWLVCIISYYVTSSKPRGNQSAPAERVYDFADILTAEEEQELRDMIAKKETRAQGDIVLVTICENVEAGGLSWESAMTQYADDFYDENNYGYDKIHGNGVLLLDNWYEDESGSQKGSWLSTCGNAIDRYDYEKQEELFDDMFLYIDSSPFQAYQVYIEHAAATMSGKEGVEGSAGIVIVIPLIVLAIYIPVNLSQKKAKNTVQANTYVADGKPDMKQQSDDFVRKYVTKTHIPQNTGSGSSSSGGGGSHRSSGGVSHGGGGRRR